MNAPRIDRSSHFAGPVSGTMSGPGGHIAQQIESFQAQGDLYTKKIEIEKRRIVELNEKLRLNKARLAEARRSMGGVNEAAVQMRKKQRQMRTLENQLEKVVVRLNEATAFNERQRREIEDLRREKLQRNAIEKAQMKKLEEKKVELVAIIEQSQKAMEARDLARAQIVALKKRIGLEVEHFEHEWMQRMNKLEADRKAYNDHVKDARLKMEKNSHQGKLTVAQEATIKAKSTKAYWNIAKREIDLEKQAEKITMYKRRSTKSKSLQGSSPSPKWWRSLCAARTRISPFSIRLTICIVRSRRSRYPTPKSARRSRR